MLGRLQMSRNWLSAVILACIAALGGVSCDPTSIDPTEQTFDVRIVNDLVVATRIEQCTDAQCDHLGDRQDIRPHAAALVGAAAYATNRYVVVADGSRLGCLTLTYSSKPHDQPSLALSSAIRACQNS